MITAIVALFLVVWFAYLAIFRREELAQLHFGPMLRATGQAVVLAILVIVTGIALFAFIR